MGSALAQESGSGSRRICSTTLNTVIILTKKTEAGYLKNRISLLNRWKSCSHTKKLFTKNRHIIQIFPISYCIIILGECFGKPFWNVFFGLQSALNSALLIPPQILKNLVLLALTFRPNAPRMAQKRKNVFYKMSLIEILATIHRLVLSCC